MCVQGCLCMPEAEYHFFEHRLLFHAYKARRGKLQYTICCANTPWITGNELWLKLTAAQSTRLIDVYRCGGAEQHHSIADS